MFMCKNIIACFKRLYCQTLNVERMNENKKHGSNKCSLNKKLCLFGTALECTASAQAKL